MVTTLLSVLLTEIQRFEGAVLIVVRVEQDFTRALQLDEFNASSNNSRGLVFDKLVGPITPFTITADAITDATMLVCI